MYKISEVTVQDLPKINKLENQLNLNKTKLNFFNQTLSNENFKFFKLVLEKKIIGFLQFSLNKSECDIISIGIIQKFQNMGYGKLLLEHLKSLNLKSIFVEVSANNENAIMFYQKLNFFKIGLRKNYYKKQKSDAILLKLENLN
jgi:ribosomal-protein-alanine N-acetyltransferase